MRPTIDDEHFFVALARQPFGDDAPGETGANDEPIKHELLHSRTARVFLPVGEMTGRERTLRTPATA